MPEVSPSPTGPAPPGDSIILEEEIDPNYVPSQDEIDEYAKWLGMEFPRDSDLMWIAREGLKAPLPEHWKPCKTSDGEIYYFNFSSGESVWPIRRMASWNSVTVRSCGGAGAWV